MSLVPLQELIAQGADIELQSTNFLWFDGLSMPSGSTPLYVASSLNRVQIAQVQMDWSVLFYPMNVRCYCLYGSLHAHALFKVT